jgi:hypothetical protein
MRGFAPDGGDRGAKEGITTLAAFHASCTTAASSTWLHIGSLMKGDLAAQGDQSAGFLIEAGRTIEIPATPDPHSIR